MFVTSVPISSGAFIAHQSEKCVRPSTSPSDVKKLPTSNISGSLKAPGPANVWLASLVSARFSIVSKSLLMSCVVRQQLATPPGPNAFDVASPYVFGCVE